MSIDRLDPRANARLAVEWDPASGAYPDEAAPEICAVCARGLTAFELALAQEVGGPPRCVDCVRLDLLPEEATKAGVAGSAPSSSRVRPATGSAVRPPLYTGTNGRTSAPSSARNGDELGSWQAIDIVALAAHPPEPPEIVGLFYSGRDHLVSGEPEAGKSWLVLIAAAEELKAGRGVLWVDGDEVGPGALLERLRALGVEDAAISERFAYIAPNEPIGDRLGDVLAVISDRGCRFVVLDGLNPLLVLHDLDPNVGADVERFWRALVAPLREAGAAVALSDNVVKSREARGRWAIGSERKASKVEVHFGLHCIAPLARGATGRSRITVHKDRPGHLARPCPGVLVLASDGEHVTWRIEPDESRPAEGGFRPTQLMLKVSRFLERRDEPLSRNQIEQGVGGKGKYVRQAVDRLVEEGYAVEVPGPNRARLVRLVRPFAEETPPDSHDDFPS